MAQYAFGVGTLYATRNDSTGYTPVSLGELQEVTLDISFNSKELYGRKQFPVALARGQGKVTGKAKFARINGLAFNNVFLGMTSTTVDNIAANDDPYTGPGDPDALLIWDEANWNEDDNTWTMTDDGPLVHVTGNTTTVTATLEEAIQAGHRYRVTITGTGSGDTATYKLGNTAGTTTIAATGSIAIDETIVATNTNSLVITPASSCTVSITEITVEADTFEVEVDEAATFVEDLGVKYATTDAPLTLVTALANLTTGTYMVDEATGIYTFDNGDKDESFLISYSYEPVSADGVKTVLTNENTGSPPTFKLVLQNSYDDKIIQVILHKCVSSKVSMAMKLEDFFMQDFDFQAFANQYGNVLTIKTEE